MFGGQHLFLHWTAKVRSVNHNSSRTDMTFLAEERSSEIFIRTPPPGFRIDVGNLRRFSIWASMMANDHPFPKKDLDAVLESLFQYRIDSWIGAHISSNHPCNLSHKKRTGHIIDHSVSPFDEEKPTYFRCDCMQSGKKIDQLG
jgi:hypothetical protein